MKIMKKKTQWKIAGTWRRKKKKPAELSPGGL